MSIENIDIDELTIKEKSLLIMNIIESINFDQKSEAMTHICKMESDMKDRNVDDSETNKIKWNLKQLLSCKKNMEDTITNVSNSSLETYEFVATYKNAMEIEILSQQETALHNGGAIDE